MQTKFLTSQNAALLKRKLSRYPIQVVANQEDYMPIELCAAIRRAGELLEAQPIEIQYLLENATTIPPSIMRNDLAMSASQFYQLCSKYDLINRQSSQKLTLTEATQKTRWLIEKKLNLPIDDSLPRRITSVHFTENNLNNCVEFATKQKENDSRYRGFPAVAFLLCTAYPGAFQPFQFRHAKGNSYFEGRDGKKRYLEAVRWMLEEKLQLKRDLLKQTASNKYFLRTVDLQYYGLGAHLYRRFFPSKQVLLEELLRNWSSNSIKKPETTNTLRTKLLAAGRNVDVCEVPGCTTPNVGSVDIHHIIPKATRNSRVDLNSTENLIALCPNHHRAARDFPWEAYIRDSAQVRKEALLEFLSPQ
jgi:hypothetical protein